LYQIPERRSDALAAYHRAIELADKRLEVNRHDAAMLASTAVYHALLGDEKMAREKLAAALTIGGNDPEVLFSAALAYNHFADDTQTLDYLKKAVDAGYPRRVVRDTPDFDHLRGNPRFSALLPNN
jgi:tetratricopeptide (TPR) repeat protein